jgi:hypothetical protein
MNNPNNLLNLFNTVNDIFTTLSKIKLPTKEISKVSKFVNDNKKTILTTTAVMTTTATVTTAINNKNTKAKVQNSFKEGVKKGEYETKKKFANILLSQKTRDEFLILMTKIGSHIAKLDGKVEDVEIEAINNFIGRINFESPSTHEIIKEELNTVITTNYETSELIEETILFLKKFTINRQEYINFMEELILVIIRSDNYEHESELEFYNIWKNQVKL